jgi:hypothetical protein
MIPKRLNLEGKKYILAVGCSFTDKTFTSAMYPDYDCSYPKWPEILGKKLGDLHVANVGQSGVSNDWIFGRLVDHVLNNPKPWMVVVGMTESLRFSPYNHYQISPHLLARMTVDESPNVFTYKNLPEGYTNAIRSFTKASEHIVSAGFNLGDGEIISKVFDHHINVTNRIINFCKAMNIKVMVGNLLWPINPNDVKHYRGHNNLPEQFDWIDLARMFTRSMDYHTVDKNVVLGWPYYPEVGGNMVTSQHGGWDRSKHIIGPIDGHPNKLGHEYIAEKYYEHYQTMVK